MDDARDGENFPRLEQALADVQRILRPRGMLIISTVLSTTVRESIWFLQLQAGIRDKLAKTHLSVNQYMDMFGRHGFRCVTAVNLLTATATNIYPNFLEPDSILDESWRQASNMFDVATNVEMDQMITAARDKKANGGLDAFVKENDHTSSRGFVTIFACTSYA